ncbi:hypothetical protein [Virgibacillus profundi]|uniref:hypothetical protein n=1 Tax=Virgibacillus profundi TaxID=2024555 RepID=UPI0019809904|nr:hypothetical protein [Virgibacillus profundi]
MGVKENTNAFIKNGDIEAIENIELPALDILTELNRNFDYIHLFTKNKAGFKECFPKLKLYLKPSGMLWVSWLKGGKLRTDLTMKTVIKLGYDFGLG